MKDLYQLLIKEFGSQGWWPLISRRGKEGVTSGGYHPGHDYSPRGNEIFEVAVGAILTQNTSWSNVSIALENLSQLLASRGTFLAPDSLLGLSDEALIQAVRPSGYYNQKAKKLRLIAQAFIAGGWSEGSVPERKRLLALWGVGPETADSILLYGFGRPYFVVDAYTRRIAARLQEGFGQRSPRSFFYTGAYDEIASSLRDAMALDSPAELKEVHALFVRLGKDFCRKKPRCSGCPCGDLCRFRRFADNDKR